MRKSILIMLMVMAGVVAKAQDEVFTDEDLTKYATVMVWAETERSALSSVVSDSVAIWLEQTELTNAQYNTLSKAEKEGTLADVEATEAELTIFNEIKARIDGKTETFKDTYITKIKEDIGAGLYNKLKTALKTNKEVESRYDAIYASLEAGEPDAAAAQ